MHLIRRAAFRGASSPSNLISSSHSITTSTPFVLRSKAQSALTPSVFRRFNSDEASQEKSNVESADGEHGSVLSATESATESASTYASETAESASNYANKAAESVSKSFENAKESVVDAATSAGAAAGGYAPRVDRPSGGYGGRDQFRHQPSGDGMGAGDRNRGQYGGGDRGGYGDRRGGYGNGYDRGIGRGENSPSTGRVIAPNSSIYVGNLLFDITADDLKREFEQFGPIQSAVIAQDARGLSKGFGYIGFETINQATAAIEAKHQTVLEGRRLIVNYMNQFTTERTSNPPSKTLFIGNLAFEMSDADLNKLFRDIRNVIDVRVAIDRRTGQPRGFAHADFVDVESAIKGKETLAGKEIYGRVLRVDFSGVSSRSGRGDGGAPAGGSGSGDGSF